MAGHAGRDRGLSHFDAYVLFGALDNRGTPSTAIDLTKNLIMAQAESNNLTIDDRFGPWQMLPGKLSGCEVSEMHEET